MASSYVNDLRLNEMATGDASGTWGTVTNTNLELIGEALGFGTEAITTNADTHTSTVADGATDPVRAMFVKYTGTLDSSCTITIAPNTLNRMHFIENGTSGGQNILISQGSGANVTIPPGDTKAVYLNGAGSGAAVIDAFASLSVIDLKVQDDLTFTSDSAVITFGSDNDTTLTHTDGSGLTLNGTNKLMFNDASQFIQGSSATVLSIGATNEIDLTATAIDVNGTMDVSGAFTNGSTIVSTGKITADAGIDIDNINIDGTTIALSSGDLTLDIASDLNIDVDDGRIFLKDGGTTFGRLANASTNFEIVSVVQDKDILFKGNDGGSEITVLQLDMSDAGSATFSHNVKLPDNGVLALGAGSDLSLSSNGTNGTIAAPNGTLTIDVAGDITLDAGGGDIFLKDDGTQFGTIAAETGGLGISSAIVQDSDIIFKGNDGGSTITALTLDMSDGGSATFNHDISLADNGKANFGSSADFQIYHDSSNAYLRNELQDSDIIFQGNDGGTQSEIARFDVSSRGFAIGVNNTGLHTCVISGDTGGSAVLKVQNSAGSGNTTTYLSFMDGSGAASVNSAHFQGYNGANNFYLLGNGTTTFTSDENAKKNIETTRDGYLEDLAKLRVVKYNWKEDEDGADKELGLIAQEVEKVFPKLVMLDIDPQIEDADKKKMIKTTVLPFMLLKALQEANTKMTALEARITELEGA